ncbi:MAG: DUF4277 domain-containing protein [Mycobacteriales bacterium]
MPSAGSTRRRRAHREVGPLILVAHYLRRLGLVGLVDAAVPMRGRVQLTHGEVIAALVANRLSDPAPLYDVAGRAGRWPAAELCSAPASLLNDDRLGRALDALARWWRTLAADCGWPPWSASKPTPPGCTWI